MSIYHRTVLAKQMAEQLIHPTPLDEGLRSGLFLSGQRRVGKTTFLRYDLIPALEALGAIVVYVDLWSDLKASTADLVIAAVRDTLADLQAPHSTVIERLKRLSNLSIGPAGISFSFKLDDIGKGPGATMADALTALVDQTRTDVVLLIDEVQQAITTEEGNTMLHMLKAARDAVNLRPATPGRFILVGTGSHRALVSELTTRKNQAFEGATSVAYPLLEADYVDHVLQRLTQSGIGPLPSRDVAVAAFRTLGNRPEDLLKALRLLYDATLDGQNPDEHLPTVAKTLRSTAADVEIEKIEQLGTLAVAVFDRIADRDSNGKGLFSKEAIDAYSARIGRAVDRDEIQPIVNGLLDANLAMRRGHGRYEVTDPFVQEIWSERKNMLIDFGQ